MKSIIRLPLTPVPSCTRYRSICFLGKITIKIEEILLQPSKYQIVCLLASIISYLTFVIYTYKNSVFIHSDYCYAADTYRSHCNHGNHWFSASIGGIFMRSCTDTSTYTDRNVGSRKKNKRTSTTHPRQEVCSSCLQCSISIRFWLI